MIDSRLPEPQLTVSPEAVRAVNDHVVDTDQRLELGAAFLKKFQVVLRLPDGRLVSVRDAVPTYVLNQASFSQG